MTKLDGLVNQPKFERIQFLTLTLLIGSSSTYYVTIFTYWTMFWNFEVYDKCEWSSFVSRAR